MTSKDDCLLDLLGGLCNGVLSPDEERRLADLLRDEPDARRLYVRYMDVHLALTDLDVAGELADSLLADAIADEPTDADFAGFPYPNDIAAFTEPDPQSGTRFGSLAYFSQVGPLSYMVATVIMCAMLLTAWSYKITHYDNHQTALTNPTTPDRPPVDVVGYISVMKDCRWEAESDGTMVGAAVCRGRKYAISSGLMEITYATGAKVILEGPCEYTANSRNGGYLRVGKLVARVEKNDELRMMNDESRSRNSDRHHSSFINHHLFAIHTPTAVVTDLGTEFGVEVSKNGSTTSHVFRGSVRVQLVEAGQPREIVLEANESSRVEKREGDILHLLVGKDSGNPPKFSRRLIELPEKLDLLDIVAGGNGAGNRREAGINPTNGVRDLIFTDEYRRSDCRYWPVVWSPFIDGVFVPDGRIGTSRISTAGHVFADFPETKGASFGSIWARAGKCNVKNTESWVYCIGDPKQFMPEGLGLLALHPNAGITFNLKAIRGKYLINTPMRFRAVAGIADARFRRPVSEALVSIWILVDGRLEIKKEGMKVDDPPAEMDVELGTKDQFLTLIATDGGNGMIDDWVIFGDPYLDVKHSEAPAIEKETIDGQQNP